MAVPLVLVLFDQLVFTAVSSAPSLSFCCLCSTFAFTYLVLELQLWLSAMTTIIKLRRLYQLGQFSYPSASLGKSSLRSHQHG